MKKNARKTKFKWNYCLRCVHMGQCMDGLTKSEGKNRFQKNQVQKAKYLYPFFTRYWLTVEDGKEEDYE